MYKDVFMLCKLLLYMDIFKMIFWENPHFSGRSAFVAFLAIVIFAQVI